MSTRLVPILSVLMLAYACGKDGDDASNEGTAGRGGKSAAGRAGSSAGTRANAGKAAGGKSTSSGGAGGAGGKAPNTGGTSGNAGGESGSSGKGTGGRPAHGGSGGDEVGGGGMSEGGAGSGTGGSRAGTGGSGAGKGGSGAVSGGDAGGEAGASAGQGGEAGAGLPPCLDGIDADGDGFGAGCPLGPDCDDFETSIHPGAQEVCGNAFDDDCDAETTDACPVTCPTGGCGVGCADGTREAFKDATTYPHIAGCDGGFSQPGVLHADAPLCGRIAGNDSDNPNGDGCSAADLCAPGWHLCRHPTEVSAHSPDGCNGSHDATSSFYVTRQSGSGCGACAVSTDATKLCTSADCNSDCYPTDLETNDVFGCGTLGAVPLGSCAPFDRFSQNVCGSLGAPWDCTGSDGYNEALFVHKNGPAGGGALCCSD